MDYMYRLWSMHWLRYKWLQPQTVHGCVVDGKSHIAEPVAECARWDIHDLKYTGRSGTTGTSEFSNESFEIK